jgi:dephospho-CoA kinase
MIIIGLTGSIGMGKSTVAGIFRAHGVSVFDADAEVHRLYEWQAVPLIADEFPSAVVGGRVDRARLAAALDRDPSAFVRLEALVHPLVTDAERAFLHAEAQRGADMAVLEIPLLFETGLDAKVDAVVVVSAPADVQRQRVLARPGMTAARLETMLTRQLSDADKQARADFIVDTSRPMAECEARVGAIIETLRSSRGGAFERHWR